MSSVYDFVAKVKMSQGKGELTYQQYVTENLFEVQLSCHSIYSEKAYPHPLFLVCNGSLVNITKPVKNVLAMVNFSEPNTVRHLCDGLRVPLTIFPPKLEFTLLSDQDLPVSDFKGFLIIELSSNYRRNKYI